MCGLRLFAAPSQVLRKDSCFLLSCLLVEKECEEKKKEKLCYNTEKIHNTDTEDWAPCYRRSLRHKTETGDWEPC